MGLPQFCAFRSLAAVVAAAVATWISIQKVTILIGPGNIECCTTASASVAEDHRDCQWHTAAPGHVVQLEVQLELELKGRRIEVQAPSHASSS